MTFAEQGILYFSGTFEISTYSDPESLFIHAIFFCSYYEQL